MTDQVKPIMIRDLFGVEVEDFQTYQPPSKGKNAIRFDPATAVPVNVFADVIKPAKTVRAIAVWDRDYMKDKPACTENKAGKGRAVYYASFFNLEAARHLIRRYAAAYNLKPLMAGVPANIEVTRRTKDGQDFYFVLNHDEELAALKPGPGLVDAFNGAPVPPAFTLKPFEYRVFRRAP
jgi:beta-galactosidase